MVKVNFKGKGIGGHRTTEHHGDANHSLKMFHLYNNRSPPESFFQGREREERNNGARTIQRLFKNIHATGKERNKINERLNLRKNQRNIVTSGLVLEHRLPVELYKNIAQYAGKGLNGPLVKGSRAAKEHMDWLRSLRRK